MGLGGSFTKRKALPGPGLEQPVHTFIAFGTRQAQQPRPALCHNWKKKQLKNLTTDETRMSFLKNEI